jgi:hypothetical protein
MVIKLRIKRWARYSARLRELRIVYRIFVREPEGKKSLGRSRRRWENVKGILKEQYMMSWNGFRGALKDSQVYVNGYPSSMDGRNFLTSRSTLSFPKRTLLHEGNLSQKSCHIGDNFSILALQQSVCKLVHLPVRPS